MGLTAERLNSSRISEHSTTGLSPACSTLHGKPCRGAGAVGPTRALRTAKEEAELSLLTDDMSVYAGTPKSLQTGTLSEIIDWFIKATEYKTDIQESVTLLCHSNGQMSSDI